MKKQLMAILLGALFISFNACQSNSNSKKEDKVEEKSMDNERKTIAFKTAENYFVKNNVKDTVPSKITNQEQFDNYFGIATTMGENGKPTSIDFSKEYVIVVDYPTTDKKTEITPVSLETEANDLVFKYTVKVGEDAGFSMHPFLMIIVDNSNTGNVVLRKQ